jgi:glutathione S-transferase
MFKLYGFYPTRSARVKWALQEIGADFEYIEKPGLVGSDELRKLHPLAKVPAFVHDDKVLFESVAIVNYVCDLHPEAGLIAKPGSYERALHDQWSCYALAELETWTWIMAKHEKLLPEENRVSAIIPQAMEELRKSVLAVEGALTGIDYLVGNEFSAADINIGYVLNQARARGLVPPYGHTDRYLDRIGDRPASTIPEQRAYDEGNP